MGSLQRIPSAGAVENGYPHGHLGELTNSETQALKEFKTFLGDKGLYKPGPPPSHDDSTLLRFLRARRWVVCDPQAQGAFEQFSETERFRGANEIEILYDTIDIDAYEETRKLYPRYTGRRDKRGIPIYVFQIRHLDSKAVAAYEKSTQTTYSKAKTDGKTPPKLLRLFALYENLTRFVQPLTSFCTERPHPETPITLSTNIVDISQVSLRMFWNLKAHMQVASELATAHYPETLDRIFIIGAPAFFSTVWGWIKRWFDPVTVSKIFILSQQDVIPVLTQFMNLEDIPTAYGGKLEWSFFDDPKWDDEILRICNFENGHTTFPHGPVSWRCVDAEGTELEAVAVGTKGGKERRERVCTVKREYRTSLPVPPAGAPEVLSKEEKAEAEAATKKTEESNPEATADDDSDDANSFATAHSTEATTPAPAANGEQEKPAREGAADAPPTAKIAALSVADDEKQNGEQGAVEKKDAAPVAAA